MIGKNNRKKQSRKINRKKSIGKNQQEKINRKKTIGKINREKSIGNNQQEKNNRNKNNRLFIEFGLGPTYGVTLCIFLIFDRKTRL